MQIARLVVFWILSRGLTYALQRWDYGRLTEEQREHAWNGATWGAAIFQFGPYSMLGWGWVTRRGRGLVLGLLCVIGLFVALWLADLALCTAFGIPEEQDLFG